MDNLRQKFYDKYTLVQTKVTRDFINQVDWKNRFIGIKGSRGVGKTTLVLQYIKQNYKPDKHVLYVSLDDLYFAENKLYSMAEEFYKKGGLLLAIDEVHRYSDWAIELKNIYDDMPNLKVIFSGSSLLHLQKAKSDLSRRAVIYAMPGLSFREFLQFETGHKFQRLSLTELLSDPISYAMEVNKKTKPLALFDQYLNYGYYPFYKENKAAYHSKLEEVILTVLEIDIPQFAAIQASNMIYLKKLLTIISKSVPFKPNMSSLSSRTGISLNTLKVYLKLLNESTLLRLLYVDDKGINSLNKPEKIYLNNTNLMFNLGNESTNKGNLRETFFYSQVDDYYSVRASTFGDFLVDDKYVFEVGGKNKTTKQTQGIDNAFVVKDDIEIGTEKTIPLWLFGFLY
jgi:predicted AAA+ superfamily ATPase